MVERRSHEPKVRGSISSLATWESYLISITPVHPAVFKMGTGREENECILVLLVVDL